MTALEQNGKVSFPNRDGIGQVTANRADVVEGDSSLNASMKPERTSLPPEVPTVEGRDGRTYVLIDRGDGFVFRVPVPATGSSPEE